MFKTTSGQAFIFPASGTGVWEASLSNTLSPGDRVLAARFGMFSQLWIDMAQRLGLTVDVLDAEWGEGAPIERYQEALAADKQHQIKAVLFTHNETATGVTSDVAAMRKALNDTKHPALLMVDGVSSIASIDFRMDEWGVDLAVTGSQKGFMLPAGLGIVCVEPEGARAVRAGQAAARLLRLRRHAKGQRHGLLPVYARRSRCCTACVSRSTCFGGGPRERLCAAPPARGRHPPGGRGVGARARARAPTWHSDTVSAVMVPAGINAALVIDIAFRRYDLALGAGLARMGGKLFRSGTSAISTS